MEDTRIFSTTNVDLGSFLILEGIKMLECQMKDSVKKIVVLRFLDEAASCLDLERVYLNSEYKKFRDINKYLLKKVHEAIRDNAN